MKTLKMKINYTIQKFESTEFKDLIPLMKNCFGLNVDEYYFKWKYFENPAGDLIGYVAEHEDKIVGFLGATPATYIYDGEKFKVYQAVDLMTHSDYRRIGIFKKISTQIQDYINSSLSSFQIAFPESGSNAAIGFKKIGWEYMFFAAFYFKPHSYIKISNLFNHQRKGITIKEINDLSLISDFTLNYNLGKRVSLVKDFNFLKWRLANPRFKYNIIGSFKQDDLIGYIIYSINEYNDIFIVDALGFQKFPDSMNSLFSYLQKQVLINNYRSIMTFVQKNTLFHKIIVKNKFIYNPLPWGPLNKKIEFLSFGNKRFKSPNDWHITPIDMDCV